MDADGENEVVVLAKQDETSGLALYVVKDFVKAMLRFCCRFIDSLVDVYERFARILLNVCRRFMNAMSEIYGIFVIVLSRKF